MMQREVFLGRPEDFPYGADTIRFAKMPGAPPKRFQEGKETMP